MGELKWANQSVLGLELPGAGGREIGGYRKMDQGGLSTMWAGLDDDTEVGGVDQVRKQNREGHDENAME